MKYRLKKDLPFAKAGIILSSEVTSKAGVKIYVQGETFSNQRESILIGYAKELIEEGWIELVEVKPREWKLLLVNGRPYDYSYAPIESFDKQEIIKVREVIE